MREEYRNKTPDNGDFWREKSDFEQSGDGGSGSADEASGSGEDEDKGPFTDEFLTYHAAIRAIDMARDLDSRILFEISFFKNPLKRHETADFKSKIVETGNNFHFYKR